MKIFNGQYVMGKMFIIMFCFVVALLHTTGVYSEELTADKLLNFVHMTPQHREALMKGEILAVSTGDEASEDVTKSDLYSGLVTWAQEPFQKAVGTIKSPSFKVGDKKIWQLPESGHFPDIPSGPGDKEEAERILRFSKGDTVNLSTAEVDTLQGLGLSLPLNTKQLARFFKAYREVLEKRFSTYRQKGIAGIAPYTRGKGKSHDAGEHVQAVTDMTLKTLGPYAPEFFKDMHKYPNTNDRSQQYLLFRDTWEGRPQYILVHRMAEVAETSAFFMHREYYVSHSYDALQATILCVPYKGGTLIAMATDVLTDKVAGFGSSIAHKIGRKQVRAKAEIRLKEIKKMIKRQ